MGLEREGWTLLLEDGLGARAFLKDIPWWLRFTA
jgi:hypothetical protein